MTTTARETAGRALFEAEGWPGRGVDWDEMPERLRRNWRNVAAGDPIDATEPPPTVPPPVLDDVGGRPVVTPTLRPGLL